MLPQDTIEKRDSQGRIQRYIRTPRGVVYRILRPFGKGGVGQVYHVQRREGDKNVDYVIKEYPKPNDPLQKKQQQGIHTNLTQLIAKPVLDENKQPLPSMVPPIEILDFPHSGTFGYVMDFVDTRHYVSVSRLMSNYPGMDIVCSMAENISHFFNCLASGIGHCYKDVNEGNIYLNPANGDVRIIDNDNVGDPKIITISGTGWYMAPEVQRGEQYPNRETDRFSLACYLLRLFTGARPYEGSGAVKYALDRDKTINDSEIAKYVFGEHPVFIFDPNDTSNTLKMYPVRLALTASQEKEKNAWRIQQEMWDLLPKELQAMFIRAFVDGAHNPNKRPTAKQWYRLFGEQLKPTIVTCPHCGKKTFGTAERCCYCGREIKRVVCKSCGAQTPADIKNCVHCGRDPKRAPARSEQTALCPHCRSSNRTSARICTTCKKYITVTCSCGASNSGKATHCAKCGAPLFTKCPSCARAVAVGDSTCPNCGTATPKKDSKCPKCGALNFSGQRRCSQCRRPLRGWKSKPKPVPSPAKTLELDLTVLCGKTQSSCTIKHTFPSSICYGAAFFNKSLSNAPLFKFAYNAAQNVYALMNVSGGPMLYMEGMNRKTLASGERALLREGMQFRLNATLVFQIDALRG